jgi:hypothetical protein
MTELETYGSDFLLLPELKEDSHRRHSSQFTAFFILPAMYVKRLEEQSLLKAHPK